MDENLEAQMNLLAHVPKGVAFMIMKKLSPRTILSLCSTKNKEVIKLCEEYNFIHNAYYKKIWHAHIKDLINGYASMSDEFIQNIIIGLPPVMAANMCKIGNRKFLLACDSKFQKKYMKVWSEQFKIIDKSKIDPKSWKNVEEIFLKK